MFAFIDRHCSPRIQFIILSTLLGVAATLIPWINTLDIEWSQTLLFRLRGTRIPPPDVAVIALDELSARKLRLVDEHGMATDVMKWPRTYHVNLINNLKQAGAKAIIFDVIFRSKETGDERLAKAIQDAGNVVLLSRYDHGKKLSPRDIFQQVAARISSFKVPGSPRQANQYWLYLADDYNIPTLPIAALHLLAYPSVQRLLTGPLAGERQNCHITTPLASPNSITDELLELRNLLLDCPKFAAKLQHHIETQLSQINSQEKTKLLAYLDALAGPASRFVDFYGPIGTIPNISFYKVASSTADLQEVSRLVRDKVVFVGYSEDVVEQRYDCFPTAFTKEGGYQICGVEIAATGLANLLERRTLHPLNLGGQIVVSWLWAILLAIITAFPVSQWFFRILGLYSAYLLLSYLLFVKLGIFMLLVTPLIIQTPVILFFELLRLFYENVIQLIPGNYYTACCATDISGFTKWCQPRPAHEICESLTEYHQLLSEIITSHKANKVKGYVSDVIGDGSLSFWKNIKSDYTLHTAACSAALEISRTLLDQSKIKLLTRVGIHAGELTIVTTQCGARKEIRPVGNIVNETNRIEEYNKVLGTQILVSEIIALNTPGFIFRPLGEFLLAGLAKPFPVYELMCREDQLTEAQRELIEKFAQGLEHFSHHQWQAAILIFSHLVDKYQDGPSRYYSESCQQYSHADGFQL